MKPIIIIVVLMIFIPFKIIEKIEMKKKVQSELIRALLFNNLNDAECALKKGANPNKFYVGFYPLDLADCDEMIDLLRKYGATKTSE